MSPEAEPAPERPDAATETRAAAKWLIAGFASVGAVVASGLGLSDIGELDDTRFAIAVAGFVVAAGGVIAAISLVTNVLAPAPVPLAKLRTYAERRNTKAKGGRQDELVSFVEEHPAVLQGLVPARERSDTRTSIHAADDAYNQALADRWQTADAYWQLVEKKGEGDPETKAARLAAETADNRALTIHNTVRRLERLVDEHLTILKFRQRRVPIAIAACAVALGVLAFAAASNPPKPATADLRGAELRDVDLSGASLRGANLSGMTLEDVNLLGTNLEGADVDETKWKKTVCPDGTESDNAGDTCEGHLDPVFSSSPLD